MMNLVFACYGAAELRLIDQQLQLKLLNPISECLEFNETKRVALYINATVITFEKVFDYSTEISLQCSDLRYPDLTCDQVMHVIATEPIAKISIVSQHSKYREILLSHS